MNNILSDLYHGELRPIIPVNKIKKTPHTILAKTAGKTTILRLSMVP